MKLNNQTTNIIAACLLLFVFFICLFSMSGDSLTMDELAHLPAGYSYLTQKDMRLNPEHPPLIKELAAFPLVFIKGINFPSEIKAWKNDVNGQWDFGNNFLFKSNNPADKMIFWGRIPMILFLILLGFYIFKWTKEAFGNKAGLLSLFFFSFSPTFLAHGRLVTTDVGAAAGAFIATYYFLKVLKEPSKKNIILSGIAFGLAELCKFSLILLIPFFALLAIIHWFVGFGNWRKYLKIFIFVLLIGYVLVGIFYQYIVLNYPPEKQVSDTAFILNSFKIRPLANLLIWMADKPILRGYSQYGLGLAMVLQRASGGNTTYFLGEVSAAGWKNYFPIVYLIKEPLVFHIFTLFAILYAVYLIKKPFWKNTFTRMKDWIKEHFTEFSMLIFIGIYWATSLNSNLNIGVRHLLPVFPFTFSLVALMIVKFLKGPYLKLKYFVFGFLILWQVVSVIKIYPHYLAYFNEIIGGPNLGYTYVVDSNLDWGQDLKRLKQLVDEKGIEKIYVDYFGGTDAQYYLKTKYAPWWGTRNPEELPKGSYLAVSATFLQGGRGTPAPGFNQPQGFYHWLDEYTPIAKIGYSIFVYYIN